MHKSSLASLILLLLVSLACGSTPDIATPTIDQHALETVVAATLEIAEVPTETIAAIPTNTLPAPTTHPPASPTELQACLPAHPGIHSISQPIGFGGNINTLAIQFFDFNGNLLGNVQTPGMTWLDPNQIHIGESLSQSIPNIPIVYNSLENAGTLKRTENGISNPLVLAPNLVTLTGAEGSSVITFSTNDTDQATGGWVSYLYAGDLEAINGAQPMLTHSAGDGFVIYPLALRVEAGIVQGVWYTLSMWGVGNINFAPYNGLYYHNFFDTQTSQFLPFTDRLAGFSPDQTLVAFLPGMGANPGGSGNSLTLRNLVTCQDTVIPFNPVTNLGAGFVSFSPDNQYLAWLEASGPNTMEAQMRLRIAKSNGDILRDALFQELSSLTGGENPIFIKPVGWLANHLLLLEIGVSSVNPLIVVWAPDALQPLDPALGANQSALLAEGVFAGFLYP